MNIKCLTTVVQLEEFLAGTQPVDFSILSTNDEWYQWIQATLIQFECQTLFKPQIDLVRHYLEKISGYSRQLLTRLTSIVRREE